MQNLNITNVIQGIRLALTFWYYLIVGSILYQWHPIKSQPFEARACMVTDQKPGLHKHKFNIVKDLTPRKRRFCIHFFSSREDTHAHFRVSPHARCNGSLRDKISADSSSRYIKGMVILADRALFQRC
ncbi:hypothetical protein PoB_003447300 [Plakobranchus ocellatus]|uniref:Uncharacterized protein n=1 Tax=Plakobranchus ocellatus TaxID=259542 RepID=A0AAV4AMF3_9GAST|nr:hypothetical protein PoB_003447300 [Plakobranchus ocellatus]